MIYVLFIVTQVMGSSVITAQEFSNSTMCDLAKNEIVSNVEHIDKAFCLPKGK